ncbi:MAG: thiamine-phosphate kinase [Nitrospirae bacterium]|nr:thiamine-phosphate kinase [Nitrospirota bacterium]
MKLSEIGELGLIQRIKEGLPLPHEQVILGIGDDAAALRHPPGSLVIITSDMFLEGIHFDRALFTKFQIGFKALSVNISDIAAMGGRPTAALISIGLPANISVKDVDSIFEGIEESAKEYGVSIIGGDTCRSRSGIILSIAVLGNVEEDLMVRRSRAKLGDAIFVTGTLGDSAMGLEILKSRLRVTGHGSRSLIEKHLLPKPRVEEGRIIAKNKWATSMIDISDGLASDLSHICDESAVGAEIYHDGIPISFELKEMADKLERDPLYYALRGGEDYELLFTVPMDRVEEVIKAEVEGRPLAAMIGNVIKDDRVLIDKDGRRHTLSPIGYNHFKKGKK